MKKIVYSFLLVLFGFGLGAITTNSVSANSNVILASVEWVLTKIAPIEQSIGNLEQRVANLENGENTPVQYSTVIVNKATAVRKGANISYQTFFTAPQGTALSYNSTFTNSITGEKWYIVKLADNKLAAIISTDVSLSNESVSIINKVLLNKNSEIKRGAATTYSSIYNGTAGQVLSYDSTFTNSITGEKWYIVKIPTGQFGAIIGTNAEVIK